MTIMMKAYGAVLTGRPFGSQVYDQIKNTLSSEIPIINFEGVLSLGSSFGEEFLVPLANRYDSRMRIETANNPVKDSINLIAHDFNLKVEYL